jgi:hypothetical protein
MVPSSFFNLSTIVFSSSSTAIEVGPLFMSISTITRPDSPIASSFSSKNFYISLGVKPRSRAMFSIITVLEAAILSSFCC